jgi:hypothetical protein
MSLTKVSSPLTNVASLNAAISPNALSTAAGSAPSYSARAWVNFNGTGTVAIRASGNVSSITDNGTGDYTVNFTTAMSDANYAWHVNGQRGDGAYNPVVTCAYGTNANAYTSATATALRIETTTVATTAVDCLAVTLAIF